MSRRSMHYAAYEPPISLWSLVELHVPDSEQPELKNLLGESAVDQSLELQQEVGTLLEIWRDVQSDRVQTESPRHLPEPPGVREGLVQQILFYVDSIKEKVSKDGRDAVDVLSSRCKVEVLDYACDSARGSTSSLSRPSTARSSRDGRETPWRQQTPSSDRALSINSIELESMNRKLNVLDFDEVSKHLTDYLEQEVQQLLEDIPFLQECIEKTTNESDTDGEQDEPTLHDLREERTKLERELLSESPPTVPNMPKVTAKLSHIGTVPSPPQTANGVPSPPRTANGVLSPPRTANSDRKRPQRPHGPIRASHAINVRVVELPDNVNPPPITAAGDEANNNVLVKMMSDSSNQRPSSAARFRRMVQGCRDT